MSWSRFVCPHCHFNSRPSARGDLLRGKYAQGVHNFNSRPSARGDKAENGHEKGGRNFNSRPSARGDIASATCRMRSGYFNSRPSARGDNTGLSKKRFSSISIHAPPRGATCFFRTGKNRHEFQFTPLREGRLGLTLPIVPPLYFNSRPSARGDSFSRFKSSGYIISIHAPPRGATPSLRM